MKKSFRSSRQGSALLALAVVLLGVIPAATADTTYKFERMWPTLQQPWYFHYPTGICADSSGYIYVADDAKNRVVKLSSEGIFLQAWGGTGSGLYGLGSEPGQFNGPHDVLVDRDGSVFVADSQNNRIQKFDAQGNLIDVWGGPESGSAPGSYFSPCGLGTDAAGNIYVADTSNHRIQKLDSDGVPLTAWDGFAFPKDVDIDSEGNIYVTDQSEQPIKKILSGGGVVTLADFGSDPGQFFEPASVFVDDADFVYVADTRNHRIQKLSSDGVVQWVLGGSGPLDRGSGPGEFYEPCGVFIDSSGYLRVADTRNNRLQTFAPTREFVAQWGAQGDEPGRMTWPTGMAIDANGNIFVAEQGSHRVQKLDPYGASLAIWGGSGPNPDGSGDAPGEFSSPYDVALDSSGNIYISDWGNSRIQKLAADGTVLDEIDGFGLGGLTLDAAGNIYVCSVFERLTYKLSPAGTLIGQFDTNGQALDVTVAPSGDVYIACTEEHRIYRYAADGTLVGTWGSYGTGQGEFHYPTAISADTAGNIYIADRDNHRIQQFNEGGSYIGSWGGWGAAPGRLSGAYSVEVAPSGDIYTIEAPNHRIQRFRPISISTSSKALIVAGGGAYPGNNLWDATQASANFAYRTLSYQGFTKEALYYLSSDTDLDLDENAVADDVDADATNANLQYALETWAPQQLNGLPTSDVVVYLVDHGGDGAFHMRETEVLDVARLEAWLDTLQAGITGKVIVVYDACESGSFLSALGNNPNRIVISSTSPGEQAHFASQGTVSFSSFFWTQVFGGASVGGAFDTALDSLTQVYNYQTPLLDDDGNGVGNEAGDGAVADVTYLGNGTIQNWSGPTIGGVIPEETINGTAEATLWADPVTDPDGIARVWAVMWPPDYVPESPTNPVIGLPTAELWPVGGDRFEGAFDGFTTAGIYTVLIYARDRVGNTSLPSLTHITVGNPLARRALIVAGSASLDPPLWPAYEAMAGMAYESLKHQGYGDDDIYYLSRTTTPGVDALSMLSNVRWALTGWAAEDTQDLVVYLVGQGGTGAFTLNESQVLTMAQLDTWLDDLQATLPGKVTVVCDASYSGAFLTGLTPETGQERIVVTSTAAGEVARSFSGGSVSFTKYFWGGVSNGATVAQAFTSAFNAMRYVGGGQNAQLDDNGDGVYHTKQDGLLARNYRIGAGILLAADDPIIGSIVGEQTIAGATATIWVDDVTTTGTIDRVVAVVAEPGITPEYRGELPTFELLPAGGNRYEAAYSAFDKFGTYTVSVTAIDTEGNASLPSETTVITSDGMDEYEVDDTAEEAKWIGLDAADQKHNFHVETDADWVWFYAEAGQIITVETNDLGANCDTYIELFRQSDMALLDDDDDSNGMLASYLNYNVTADNAFLVRVTKSPWAIIPGYGVGADYDLRVWRETGPEPPAKLAVSVVDNKGVAVAGTTITVTNMSTGLPTAQVAPRGDFLFLGLTAGTYSVSAGASGFVTSPVRTAILAPNDFQHMEIVLAPDKFLWGDLDGNGAPGTVDAALILRWLAGGCSTMCYFPVDESTQMYGCPCFPPGGDVGGNHILGELDAAMILQKKVGMPIGDPPKSSFPTDSAGDGFGLPPANWCDPYPPDPGCGGKVWRVPSRGGAKQTSTLSARTDLVFPPGSTFQVQLNLDDPAGMIGCYIELTYKSTVLEYLGYSGGSLTPTWWHEVYAQPGHLNLAGSGEDPIPDSTPGSVIALSFRVKPTAVTGQTSVLRFDTAEINDGAIGVSTSNGLVTVNSGPTPPTAQYTLLDPSPTGRDSVAIQVEFSEPVTPSFSAADITLKGTLAGTSSFVVSGTDPVYLVTLTPNLADADGTLFIEIGSDVFNAGGVSYPGGTSAAYTIHQWSGFVSLEPEDPRLYTGDPLTLVLTANDNVASQSYQWKWDDGATVHDVGSNENTLPIPAVSMTERGEYWCVVTYDDVQHVSPMTSVLDVEDHLQIEAGPVGGVVAPGDSFTFLCAVSGGYEPLSYQWKKGGIDIPGATTPTHHIVEVGEADFGVYTLEVSDDNTDYRVSAPALLRSSEGLPLLGRAGIVLLSGLCLALGAAWLLWRARRNVAPERSA